MTAIKAETIFKINRVGIIGGGTAGYLTALALKKVRPVLEVCLIESSQIPIIGVGEATTPILLKLLHKVLGIDVHDFHVHTNPTWKIGIRYEWGKPGDYYFNNPFGKIDPFLAFRATGSINHCSLISSLMDRNKSLVFGGKGNENLKMVGHANSFAYHLDNERFVSYLKKLSIQFQLKHLDRRIEKVNRKSDGVESLVTDQGEELKFDLYIDCSGFRSILDDEIAPNMFKDYSSSLFTDSAIIGIEPHGKEVNVYTTAKTMNAGWQWEIPVKESNHVGYVYSSNHCSEEEARDEMKKSKPNLQLKDGVIKFRSGRKHEFWKGNVVTIGNSYGFVEPLESTGIHMICLEVMSLINMIKSKQIISDDISKANETMGRHWDMLRWFIAIHFKYNKKLKTPFWRDCNNEVDVSGIQDYIDFYKINGPVSLHMDKELYRKMNKDSIYSPYSFDLFMLAQEVSTEFDFANYSASDIEAFKKQLQINKHISTMAIPMLEALEAVIRSPGLVTLKDWF